MFNINLAFNNVTGLYLFFRNHKDSAETDLIYLVSGVFQTDIFLWYFLYNHIGRIITN